MIVRSRRQPRRWYRRGHASTESPLRRPRFATVVGRLAGVNGLIYLFAFVTSPILARTLHPSGRGEVAAVFAVVGLAPLLADLGLYMYVAREQARGVRARGEVLGSVLPIGIATSLVGVLLAVPIAHLLGQGRREVVFFIEIGLWMLPLNVFLQTLYGALLGGERWNALLAARVLSSAGPALAIIGLRLAGHLTVATACVTYIVAGLIANIPFLVGLRGTRPWRFHRSIAREGLAFGSKSWLSQVATQGNLRLDQLLMAAAVSSRQLGFYALAVTLATLSNALIQAVSNALLPRVAIGQRMLAARACRVTTAMVVVYGVVLALCGPILVPLVFGSAWRPAVPMLIVLLGANVFLAPGQLLGAAVIAAGDPSASARSQTVGLVITVVGLIILLPIAAGLGAAVVSLLAYAASFVVVLGAARRHFGVRTREFLILNPSDIQWFRSRLSRGAPEGVSVTPAQ